MKQHGFSGLGVSTVSGPPPISPHPYSLPIVVAGAVCMARVASLLILSHLLFAGSSPAADQGVRQAANQENTRARDRGRVPLSDISGEEALHQAQLAILEKYPHPYYWAASQLTGKAR
jgi:hypothetical protein